MQNGKPRSPVAREFDESQLRRFEADAGCLLYAPGYPVEIGSGGDKIQGIVTAVTIYPYGVEYKVAWWDGRDRCEVWLTEAEVSPAERAPKVKVGFAG